MSDTPCARFPCFPTRLHNGVVAFLRIVRQHSVTLECRHARKSVVLNPGSASHVKEILIRYSCNKMNTDRLLSMDASSCGLSFVFTNRYEYTRSFHYCGHSFFFVVAYFSQKMIETIIMWHWVCKSHPVDTKVDHWPVRERHKFVRSAWIRMISNHDPCIRY